MYILDQNNIDFMAPLRGHTLKSIVDADIPTIHKLKFIKLGGPKFYEILDKSNKSSSLEKLKHKVFNSISHDTADLIDAMLFCYDMTSKGSVDKAFIHLVGKEERGKSGKPIRTQMIIKKEPYQEVYIFNITQDYGDIDLDGDVEVFDVNARTVSTFGWPTKEQLMLILAHPRHLEKKEYRTDLYKGEAYLLNFDVNNPELYK